jgi:hypothetical protein
MYDQIQTALTIAIEVIALIGFIGLPTHAIVTHHINTVRSWGTPQSMPIIDPVLEVEPVVEPTPSPETVLEVVEVESVVEQALEPISVKRVLQSVGAAGIDIQENDSEGIERLLQNQQNQRLLESPQRTRGKRIKVFVEKVLEE